MKGCLAVAFVILISSLVIGHFARFLHHDRVEDLLYQRVSGIEKSFPGIRIEYDHLTARITGKATRTELDGIKTKFDELSEGNGRVVYEVEIVRKLPSEFSVFRREESVTLQGTVDSENTKRDLGSISGVGNLTVDNQLSVSEEVAPFPSLVSAVAAIPILVHSAEDARLEAGEPLVSVSGSVATEEIKRTVSGMFQSEKWNGARIENALKLKPVPPQPKLPYLSWVQQEGGIILGGIVPGKKERDDLVGAARELMGARGGIVTDQLKSDSSALKADWLIRFPEFVTGTLPKVENPNFQLGPGESRFAGNVVDQHTKMEVSEAFTHLNPPGLAMDLKVVPPRRTREPRIEVTRKADGIRVRGEVPSEQLHRDIVDAVHGVRDELKVDDEVKKETWLSLLPGFIIAFQGEKVSNPEFFLEDRKLKLKGTVSDKEAKERVIASTAFLVREGIEIVDQLEIVKGESPEGMKNRDSNPPDPVAPIQAEAPVKERHEVFFGTGEYHIRESQREAVNAILARVMASRGKIQIDGYADERGDVETNEFLSENRALRIRRYLIENGVDPKRISSVTGHGELPGIRYPESRKTEVRIMNE